MASMYTCWLTPRGRVTLCDTCLRWEDHELPIEGVYPEMVSTEGVCEGKRHGFVVLEEMPEHARRSHRNAANWGTFPSNGATRRRVPRSDAADLIDADGDGYTHVVGGGL